MDFLQWAKIQIFEIIHRPLRGTKMLHVERSIRMKSVSSWNSFTQFLSFMNSEKKYSGGLSDYSPGFRTYVVTEYFSGSISIQGINLKYGLGSSSLGNWCSSFRRQFPDEKTNLKLMNDQERREKASLERRIKELEKKLEYERLRSLGYKTMIDVAERELGIEIEKKSGTKQ